jgi:hypothetical protein
MLDTPVQSLLEEVANTSTKLAIVLLFAEQPNLIATPSQLQQRVCRDIWSVKQALDELVEAGTLRVSGGTYGIAPGMHRQMTMLLRAYDEPLRRQEIVRTVVDLERYAPYRALMDGSPVAMKVG